ncbi:uncharacterized protein LOC120010547 [Tripterygium wilfordii]|uniref:uncharacterized protein LOC120010547 n=1 Tax=Tripterygium wilfordii TaxID=458696 RepID=UPI0018F81FEF|nr:uncharacterized protein LOC120010547 [Tripterygium wilfordii]
MEDLMVENLFIEAALFALLSLAYGSERAKTRLLIEHTLASLCGCSANQLVIVIASSGAIQVLIEILSGDYANEIVPLIISSGVVLPLLHLIRGKEKSSEMVEKAIMQLENVISLSGNALQETASTGGAIGALGEAIEDGSSQAKSIQQKSSCSYAKFAERHTEDLF